MNISIIHMQIFPADFVNMILFKCIQIFSLSPCCYRFHGVLYCAVCMSVVQYVV
jgi:hypothetical protein